jgi:RNA polymerase sigma-70 factor (ECF subfamily)
MDGDSVSRGLHWCPEVAKVPGVPGHLEESMDAFREDREDRNDREVAVARVQGLYLTHIGLVRGFARALLGDPQQADDVVQETFLTAIRKAEDYESGTNFAKWAIAIARYKVMEARRQMGRQGGMLSPEVMEALAVSDEAGNEDPRLTRLSECVELLPEKLKHLVRLRYHEDHTPAEVAERLGWTAGTV